MPWKAHLPYLLPALLLNPVLYWHGYNCWFQQDDFAWLGLLQLWNMGYDLPRLLFEPMAQGTIRPVSERAFFLAFRWLFDLNATPYHALVLLTQTANLELLYALVRRLADNAMVAGLSALLWCSNSVLAWPLAWVSAYNQILISCCFLGGANAFIRYGDTGRRRWLALSWLIFLFGFGVLELNVVFPAVLLIYSLLLARQTKRAAAWMFLPSTIFAVAHSLAAPKPGSGVYSVEFGLAQLAPTLARYWTIAVWPAETRLLTGWPEWLVAVPALTVAAVIAWRLWRRDRLVLFGMGWFLTSVSLYLLLPNHGSEYYLTVPPIGLSVALASSLTAAPRALAVAVLLLIVPVSWYGAWKISGRARDRSAVWENIMGGVAQIAQAHPGKKIYLEGIGQDVFVQGFTDNPFRLIGVSPVRLAPHEAAGMDISGWLDSAAPFTAPAEVVLRALDAGNALVFQFEGDRFRHTTPTYKTRLAASHLADVAPARLDLGNTTYEYLLGAGWFQPQDGYRWMGRSARFTMGGGRAGQQLHVRGFCAPTQLAQGPLHMTITLEGFGAPAAMFTIDICSGSFDLAMALPAALHGRPRFETVLAVDRAAPVPPDKRELGIAIEAIELR